MNRSLLHPNPKARRTFRSLSACALILAVMPLSLGCTGGSTGNSTQGFNTPAPAPMPAAEGASFVLRFLELEGPQTQPANYPGSVPGLPPSAIWGVAQHHPPVGTVNVDPSGTSARVRFVASSGPGGSQVDGAIKFTPLPDQKVCLVDYEDLRFTYAEGSSTYQGRKRVAYTAEGRIQSIHSAEDPHLILTQVASGSGVSTRSEFLDQTTYSWGQGELQGYTVDIQISRPGTNLVGLSIPQPISRRLTWSPDCNYPVSGDLAVKDLRFPAANQEATATFGPGCGALAIQPLAQPAVPWPMAPWPGQ